VYEDVRLNVLAAPSLTSHPATWVILASFVYDPF
jgi:hypothetical protein